MIKTFSPSINDLKRNWHIVDANGQVLGRLATQIASLLMGKHKTDFVRHLDWGDHVVVLNCDKTVTTGKKEGQKVYTRHTGFPSGLRQTTLEKMRISKPQEVLVHAVSGMLPKNKLRDNMIKRLHLIIGSENPYAKYSK